MQSVKCSIIPLVVLKKSIASGFLKYTYNTSISIASSLYKPLYID